MHVFTIASFSHCVHMMPFRGGSSLRADLQPPTPHPPSSLQPLHSPEARPHAGLYNSWGGEVGVIASDGARMSTHTPQLWRESKCCTHSLHKFTIFCFNGLHVLIERTLTQFVPCTQKDPHAMLHAHVKHSHRHTQGVSGLEVQGTLRLFELFQPQLGSLPSFPVSPPHQRRDSGSK